MLASGISSLLVWLVVGWLFAIGLFMALLYAVGKRDARKQART
jgi:hypothetical protein